MTCSAGDLSAAFSQSAATGNSTKLNVASQPLSVNPLSSLSWRWWRATSFESRQFDGRIIRNIIVMIVINAVEDYDNNCCYSALSEYHVSGWRCDAAFPVFVQATCVLSAWPSIRMSTGDGFGLHRWGRNGEFCVAVGAVARTPGMLAYCCYCCY